MLEFAARFVAASELFERIATDRVQQPAIAQLLGVVQGIELRQCGERLPIVTFACPACDGLQSVQEGRTARDAGPAGGLFCQRDSTSMGNSAPWGSCRL